MIKKVVLISIEDINENPENPCNRVLLMKYTAEINRKNIVLTPIKTNILPDFFKFLITIVE